MQVKFTAHTAKSPFSGNERTRVERELETFGAKLVNVMKTYPPAPPNSKYIRKREAGLGGSWTKEGPKQVGSALVVEISSDGGRIPYNKWVEGDEQRPLFASIGWKKVSDAQKSLWATAVKNITKILEQK